MYVLGVGCSFSYKKHLLVYVEKSLAGDLKQWANLFKLFVKMYLKGRLLTFHLLSNVGNICKALKLDM